MFVEAGSVHAKLGKDVEFKINHTSMVSARQMPTQYPLAICHQE